MSNTASEEFPSGSIPAGQLKQTIIKGSQTISENQKISNSNSTNTQVAGGQFRGNTLANFEFGFPLPVPPSSVNQIINPSLEIISQDQSITNASSGGSNSQSAVNRVDNSNAVPGTVSQSTSGNQNIDQTQVINNQSGAFATASQSASTLGNNIVPFIPGEFPVSAGTLSQSILGNQELDQTQVINNQGFAGNVFQDGETGSTNGDFLNTGTVANQQVETKS